eukprot:3266008-Rhodomonas_salina.2
MARALPRMVPALQGRMRGVKREGTSWYPLASTRSETNGESSASAASASCAGMTRTGGMWLVLARAKAVRAGMLTRRATHRQKRCQMERDHRARAPPVRVLHRVVVEREHMQHLALRHAGFGVRQTGCHRACHPAPVLALHAREQIAHDFFDGAPELVRHALFRVPARHHTRDHRQPLAKDTPRIVISCKSRDEETRIPRQLRVRDLDVANCRDARDEMHETGLDTLVEER